MPLVAVRHGRAWQSSGTGPCGYCRRVLWVTGPAGQYSGKMRVIEKPGVEDEGGRRVPLAAVRHGRARRSSGTRPCGYCRRVLWVPGPAGQYSGKIRFIEKPGVEDEGGVAMWLNVVLTPG